MFTTMNIIVIMMIIIEIILFMIMMMIIKIILLMMIIPIRYGHAGVIRILASAKCKVSEQNKVQHCDHHDHYDDDDLHPCQYGNH